MPSQGDILKLIVEKKGILRTDIVRQFDGQVSHQISALKKKKLITQTVYKHTLAYTATDEGMSEARVV